MAERFILECINYGMDERGRRAPIRHMFGLTMSFDTAHHFMETYFKDKFEDVLIHPLESIDEFIELSIVETLTKKGKTG